VEHAVRGFDRVSASLRLSSAFRANGLPPAIAIARVERFPHTRLAMPVTTMHILFVGKPSPHTAAILARLGRKGFASRLVETICEARERLATFPFDVVLAPEHLPDGRGYDLTDAVARHSSTLLIAISLSETCLWLPVVERGATILGERAVTADLLEPELEELFKERARENSRALRRRTSPGTERPASKQAAPSRPKHVSAAADTH
jgi:DNA-binding NtrC family response regulator